MSSASIPKVSDTFNFEDSDISLQSCDGILFKVHQRNLSAWSEVFDNMFASRHMHSDGEPLQLSESSEELDILFRFFYPALHPDTVSWDLQQSFKIGPSAQKYGVATIAQLVQYRIILE